MDTYQRNPDRTKRPSIKALLAVFSVFMVIVPGSFQPAYGQTENSQSGGKRIQLVLDGMAFGLNNIRSEQVGELLDELKIQYGERDAIFPAPDQALFYGTIVTVRHAKHVTVDDGGEKKDYFTLGQTVGDLLLENRIAFNEDDILSLPRNRLVSDGAVLKVTRVTITEEVATEAVAFKKIVKEDDKLSWREKKVSQKGVAGKEELRYRIVSHNGKEFSRKVLEKKRLEDPIDEVTVVGTYVKLGKKHTGLGTWYAFKGGMFAANPWLPIGSYVKVTNLDNGKSVIVQINDRGPFGPNRIIDLDKVAFQKIASLGAGVINVKVEEVIN